MPSHTYRVAASCFEPDSAHAPEQRRAALRSHLEQLLHAQRPDLAVLPELVVAHGIGSEARWGAELLDGPTVTMVAELAAGAKANICVPIMEDDRGELYNTAVYVDRAGRVAGAYRKQVPTGSEARSGIRPSAPDQEPVLLDGLRIGTAICFDENFSDQAWGWIDAGVDLLVFPAYTYAGELMRNWAVNCGVPLVCSFPWESVIYDRDGSVLARAGTETSTFRLGNHPPWIACSLNLHSRVYHLDGNQACLKKLAARFGSAVDLRLMVRDGRMMITTVAADLELEKLEREMGLVPLQDYLRASRAMAEGRLTDCLRFPTVQDYLLANRPSIQQATR